MGVWEKVGEAAGVCMPVFQHRGKFRQSKGRLLETQKGAIGWASFESSYLKSK